MNILAPWSLCAYYPLNGFHPLYRSISRLGSGEGRLLVPRKLGFKEFRRLLEIGLLSYPAIPQLPHKFDGELFYDEFVSSHGADELLIKSVLPADVELHHTAPITVGDRPFLLHCESFLPIFFPFFQQGTDFDRSRVESVRRFYRSLFENRNCLAIVSHIPDTLRQISEFFESGVIDKKLKALPIGLDQQYIAGSVSKSPDITKFVFVNSAHQNPRSFALRGGISSLKLAVNLLRERQDVRFYFRCKRPSDAELAAYGFDVRELSGLEASGISWIETYLSDQLQTKLISKSHFLLLPSANLHSVSIMSAMANGTIPIVTDTTGTEVYVTHRVNGIVLRGVRAIIWEEDASLRLTRDRHDLFLRYEKQLTERLISTVRDLLSAPRRIFEMSDMARRTIKQRFDGSLFASGLMEEMLTRSQASNIKAASPSSADDGERWVEDISPEHFVGPSQPLEILRMGRGVVARIGSQYLYIPKNKVDDFRTRHQWSLATMMLEEFDQNSTAGERLFTAQKLEECVFPRDYMREKRADIISVDRSKYLHREVPELIGAIFDYNIVLYNGLFYGIPQSFGMVDLSNVQFGSLLTHSGFVLEMSRDAVVQQIHKIKAVQSSPEYRAVTPSRRGIVEWRRRRRRALKI